MSGAFAALFRVFLTPVGLPVLAALDSTVIFFFPFGLDLALVLVTARNPSLAWLYPLLATAGSVAGAAATYWLGRKIGEHGVERFVDSRRMDRIKKRMGHTAAISSGFLALIPPPFPFTPFILMAGALDVSFRSFILSFAAARVIRLGAVSWLAVIYGKQIVGWMESDTFEIIIGAFIVIALAGTAYSAWRVRKTKVHDGGSGRRFRTKVQHEGS
jgi:membrane protein YqaA with SNARE-associated domain